MVGCNTAASLCTEDAAHFNADKWQYVKTVDVEGVEVKLYACGGSVKSNAVTQQEVKDNADAYISVGGCSGGYDGGKPKCQGGALKGGSAKFGGVGYRCNHNKIAPTGAGDGVEDASTVEGNERSYVTPGGGPQYYLDNRDNGCLFDRDEYNKNEWAAGNPLFSGFHCDDGSVYDP